LAPFTEIFNIIPKFVVALDLGVNYGNFSKRCFKLELFTMGEVYLMASLFRMDPKVLTNLVLDEIKARKGQKSKKEPLSPFLVSCALVFNFLLVSMLGF
jgi:hypothetical protein